MTAQTCEAEWCRSRGIHLVPRDKALIQLRPTPIRVSLPINAQGNADSPGFARVNCPLTDVLRLHRFNTPSSVYLQIDLYDGKCLAWALSGFGEMEDAADLMRGGVGLDVVGGDDCLHPFRHRLVFPLCQRRKV